MFRGLPVWLLVLPGLIQGQGGPVPQIILLSPYQCTATPLSFSASGLGSNASYTWDVAPVRSITPVTSLNEAIATWSFASAGTFTVTLRATDLTGAGSASMLVTITRNAKAAFNATFDQAGYPSNLLLTNYTSGQTKTIWRFSDQAAADSSFSTTKNYHASGSYSVWLIAYGNKGCNDTARYSFRIADSSGVTLPNVFTPNNDGVNDYYRPTARGISKLSAFIYSREGLLLSSWDTLNGFWDGFTASGEPCPSGLYFVVVEATGFDGVNYKLKGAITLLR
jgi:gliding motility-associated-like protein